MGFFERLSRLLRSNLNALVSSAEDPSKILDQSVTDMQNDLVKLRQAVAIAIASQKRLVSQEDQSSKQVSVWYKRAELALQKGDEALAKEALSRRKAFQESSSSLKSQLDAQEGQVEMLKRSLMKLEGKIAEAKTKKDMLKARAQAARAQQQLQNAVGNLGTNSAAEAFERMEDKVEALEATSKASAELAGSDLESRFALLETSDDLDDELSELREKLQGDIEAVALPPGEMIGTSINNDQNVADIEVVKVSEIDKELEELRDSIDNSK
tara:strand:- start:14322 stop:15128 length:807 start_codon:yes stop_codon:yes gene_type:complete